MKELRKTKSTAAGTVECYAERTTTVCVCARCTCPPPSVPNDIQLQKQGDVARSKSVAGK